MRSTIDQVQYLTRWVRYGQLNRKHPDWAIERYWDRFGKLPDRYVIKRTAKRLELTRKREVPPE